MCPGETWTTIGIPWCEISPSSTGLGRSTNLIKVGSNINISFTDRPRSM
jgi:hypothetical protein